MPLSIVRQGLSALPGIDLTQSWFNNIEIMPAGVDKGRGVRDMAASLGLSMDQVMALGDQDNDIPMLSGNDLDGVSDWVDESISMLNKILFA